MLNKIFIVAAIFLMISRVEAGTWSPEMRIGISSGLKQVSLQVSAPCVMIDAAKGTIIKKIPERNDFIVDFDDIKVNQIEIRPEKISLKDLRTIINSREYCGGVAFNKGRDSLIVINLVPLEEYLRGVVSKEMSPSYPTEALKAQTVAARSFAMKNRGRHAAEGFDLCSTTHCQVYDSISAYDSTDRAIDDTRGEVLTYKEKLADTNFHTDSGGMTEDVGDVWGTATPYLVAVKEIIKLSEPWTVKVTAKDFSSRFGENFGDVRSVKLSKLTIGKSAQDRTSSGRVKSAQVVGSKKTLTLEGTELRRKFSLPSTLFDMKLDDGEVIFTGFGRGHGVGMSQCGARAYALDGWSYEKILAHYYSGTKLKKLY